ncbi:MAG: GNAT family N-acetyltransferase [Proteobacteria bacterium]|nr:GNAT family N-acetyltransferase [Pseudomonadota bacterium]
MLAVLEDNPNHARCWLATERDIIGWSLIRWFEPRLKRGFDAYINVHVDSDFRKQGLGKRLITAAMAYAEENRLSYCVYGINREQQSLYRSVKIAGDRIVTFDFPRTYWEHYRFSKRLCWIPAS